MPATVNLLLNPSVENSAAGWVAVGAATVGWTGIDPYVGLQCLNIHTHGQAPGEGVRSADTTPQTTGTHTASVYLRGAGMVNLRLITNPGGTVGGTTPITLTPTWTRYTVSGPVGVGESVLLAVTTATASIASLSLDAAQIEAGTASPYCDGDQYGCAWLGTPHSSRSVREVPHPLQAAGHAYSVGALETYHSGPVPISAHGSSTSTGSLSTIKINPTGAVDDFALWTLLETDPIYGYAIQGNEGISSGAYGADWTRVYTHFVLPRSYPASTGDIGAVAAYAEVGVKFNELAAGKSQHVDRVQVEINDVMSRTPPTPYVPPRQLQIIVKPARINLVPNPSFTLNTNLWTTQGDCTLTRDTTTGVEETSPASGKITITGPEDSTYISTQISGLVPGHTYTVSAYLKWQAGINDVFLQLADSVAGASAIMFVTDGDVIPYGAGGYGEGEYGGDDIVVPPPTEFIRVYFQFVAQYANDEFQIHPQQDDVTGIGSAVWVDHIMIEDSPTLPPGDYFDGSYGIDYLWETGGAAHESPSYYYPDILDKIGVIQRIVDESIPLGISAAPVRYAVPYTQ